jgi:hypothetical protein
MTAADRFPWTHEPAELVAVDEAMHKAVAEHGLALALTTDAGRAWLKFAKDGALLCEVDAAGLEF